MRIAILVFIINLISIDGYGQFYRVNFKTDSSEVELIRNSVYKVWEEKLNGKDSIFYQVRYINDTTQVHIEGYKRRNGKYFGEWSEYKNDGTWLYTIDYTNNIWKYNEVEFKFQAIKDKMKSRADEIIVKKFGQDFFDHNVVFRFHGNTYVGKWEFFDSIPHWVQDEYLGSWIEPIRKEPNSFVINYSLKFNSDEIYDDMLKIILDSLGNLILEQSKFIIGFNEIEVSEISNFSINREKALKLCEENKIEEGDIKNSNFGLILGWRKLAEYPGVFYYQVVSYIKENTSGDCPDDCLIEKYYYVWRFNPWSSELLQAEKMVKYTRWLNGHGESGGYESLKNK